MLGNKQPPNLSGLKTTKVHFLLMLNVHDRWSGEQFIKVIQQPGWHKQPLSSMLPVGVGAGQGGGGVVVGVGGRTLQGLTLAVKCFSQATT